MHGRRPVIFFTNGYETWIWDDHTGSIREQQTKFATSGYPSRMIQGFYTQDQLQLLIERRSSRQSLQGQDVKRGDRGPALPDPGYPVPGGILHAGSA